MKVKLIGRFPVFAGLLVVLPILAAREVVLFRAMVSSVKIYVHYAVMDVPVFYWGAGTSHVADYPRLPLTFLHEQNAAPG
jgi:hypothetical protein